MSSTMTLDQLFTDQLEDMYSSEHQILKALPKLIQAASFPDLKAALTNHLKETQHQVTRLEKIFSLLGERPKEKMCEAMKGLLKEGDELTQHKTKSPSLDAAIIAAAQKVEHYEMASYGTLISVAKSLGMDSTIHHLLKETLDEESGADKKLTKLAEGSFFSSGINEKASEDRSTNPKKKHL